MGIPVAIIVGAALVSVAIIVTNHWQLQGSNDATMALRLNRWTGEIHMCMLDPKSVKANTLAGVRLACEAP
jgi:hypothetical protein